MFANDVDAIVHWREIASTFTKCSQSAAARNPRLPSSSRRVPCPLSPSAPPRPLEAHRDGRRSGQAPPLHSAIIEPISEHCACLASFNPHAPATHAPAPHAPAPHVHARARGGSTLPHIRTPHAHAGGPALPYARTHTHARAPARTQTRPHPKTNTKTTKAAKINLAKKKNSNSNTNSNCTKASAAKAAENNTMHSSAVRAHLTTTHSDNNTKKHKQQQQQKQRQQTAFFFFWRPRFFFSAD